jgi:hypothetical protein
VISVVLTLLLSGVLMPRKTVNMLLKSKDEEIELWKGIAHEREKTNQVALDTVRQSTAVSGTAVRALDALATVADSGDADASTTKVP